MEITISPTLNNCPAAVDRPLGDLLKLLSTIDSTAESMPEMAFVELATWFYDRFHLPPGTCSRKALGDALALAMRYGLISMCKVQRGRARVTTYTGIDASLLDAALAKRNETKAFPNQVSVLAPHVQDAGDDDMPEAPWDADKERIPSPATIWDAMNEEGYLTQWDLDPFGDPYEEIDY